MLSAEDREPKPVATPYAPVCLWSVEATTLGFRGCNERVGQAGTLQEPSGGDSRPQAFFVCRSASPARRRDPGMVAPAFLGLQRLRRHDCALCGCQDPAWLRGD